MLELDAEALEQAREISARELCEAMRNAKKQIEEDDEEKENDEEEESSREYEPSDEIGRASCRERVSSAV